MKIVVLCGGLSTERKISFSSGTKVCAALRAKGHQAVLIDLFMGVEGVDGFDAEDAENRMKEVQGASVSAKTAFAGDDNHSAEAGLHRKHKVEVGLHRKLAGLFEDLPPLKPVEFDGKAPDLEKVRRSRKWQSPSLFGRGVLEICQMADVVFIALHGMNGEDGRVQATFDMLGIPYTGSGYLGAAMAMDKMITKQLVRAQGVPTPVWKEFHLRKPVMAAQASKDAMQESKQAPQACEDAPQSSANAPQVGENASQSSTNAPQASEDASQIDEIVAQLRVPCVVKTPTGGSSVGVVIVREEGQLRPAVEECLRYGTDLLVEQYIEGREFTCAVLGDRALPSVEIAPLTDFYNYENKYKAGATQEICPGRCTPEVEEKMHEIALTVHRTLGLRTYSRSDFMVDADDNVWFLEVNTLPGMTPTSLVPQEAAAVGISYEELCEQIVEDALKR